MHLARAFAVLVVAYLAIALPLYILNAQAVEECGPACEEQGFDEVIGAAHNGQGLECRCFDTYTRRERYITIAG